jgi:geranylgeranyl pyrophosphate synthase
MNPSDESRNSIIDQLSLTSEMAALRDRIFTWVQNSDAEMRDALRWQFEASSKYFRPMTIFTCHKAISTEPVSPRIIGKPTMHCQFGDLAALMVSGYIVADGYNIARADIPTDPEFASYNIQLLSELMKRLGVAECMQWRLRREPLGLEDWRRIAGEDTGSMFEVCACLGARSEQLRRFGHLLGVLYHGCDDVGDVRGAKALGGGGHEDLRDGILTLPAALAIRDPGIVRIFRNPSPTPNDLERLGQAFSAQLTEAEAYLDRIAREAKDEASRVARDPMPLHALVDHTRRLSQR